jgi:uncharacterized protein (TIGR03437 family)
MARFGTLLTFCFSSFALAQNITITSVASPAAGLAPESLAVALGTGLAAQAAQAQSKPWPTTLGTVGIWITDSASTTRSAGLLYVSSTQLNFQVPAGTAAGPATILINPGGAPFVVPVQIQSVAPALFSMNNLGVAAASAIRVVIPSTMESPVPVFQCASAPGSCRLVPIALGVDTPIYLSLYGTGIRGRSSLSKVKVTIGTVDIAPLYAGPQPMFPGLDQINIPLPLSLRGAGEVNVTVTVDRVKSNSVKINVM